MRTSNEWESVEGAGIIAPQNSVDGVAMVNKMLANWNREKLRQILPQP